MCEVRLAIQGKACGCEAGEREGLGLTVTASENTSIPQAMGGQQRPQKKLQTRAWAIS